MARQLLADATIDPLQVVAEALLVGADADCAVVLAAGSEGTHFQALACVGSGADRVAAHLLHDAWPLPRHVSHTGEPLHVHDGHNGAVVVRAARAGHILLLPLPRAGGTRAVLAAVRFGGRRDFTLVDLEAAAGFACHAGPLAELSLVRAAQQRRATVELRERVAAQLHGRISRDLYSAGLAVYGVAAGLEPGPLADRLAAVTTELDRVMATIRAAALDLTQAPPCRHESLRARLLTVVAELSPELGFEPAVALAGSTRDIGAFEDVFDDVVATLRELLTTRQRDRTEGLTIALDIVDGHLTLDLVEDGVEDGVEPTGTRRRWTVPTP